MIRTNVIGICGESYGAELEPEVSATTTTENDYVSIPDMAKSFNPAKHFVLFFKRFRAESVALKSAKQEWGKYFWRLITGYEISPLIENKYVIPFEVYDEQLGYPEDVIASSSQWPILWDKTYYERKVWLGIFPINFKRKVIFSEKIEMRTSELPKWKPLITLDRHMLEE
jgi:hypothetical protein